MEFEVQKEEQDMLIYQEQSASGVHAENSNMEDDEDYETYKSQMKNAEDEKQIQDLVMNTVLIFNLQISNKSSSNNCRNEGFGI